MLGPYVRTFLFRVGLRLATFSSDWSSTTSTHNKLLNGASPGDKNIKAALQVSKWSFAIFCKKTDIEILIYDVETGSKVKEYLKPDGKVFDTPMKSQIDVSGQQLKETSLPSCQLDCCLRGFVSN
jgi:hypothetical protein